MGKKALQSKGDMPLCPGTFSSGKKNSLWWSLKWYQVVKIIFACFAESGSVHIKTRTLTKAMIQKYGLQQLLHAQLF